MRITITKAHRVDDREVIAFRSPLGEAEANWEDEPPKAGRTFDVELEVDDELVWGINISPTTASEPSIAERNGKVHIVGQLTNVDSDGVATLRLGDSWLLCQIAGDPEPVGGFLQLEVNSITLFDMDS